MKSLIFKPELAQAIYEGRKTQTRRIIKPQAFSYAGAPIMLVGYNDILGQNVICPVYKNGDFAEPKAIKPKFKIGDLFYVKETYSTYAIPYMGVGGIAYKGAGNFLIEGYKWKSPLFMPEILSRSICEITNVRTERLHDISEQDAIAEGIERKDPNTVTRYHHRGQFQIVWDEINTKRGFNWETNPWVWVYEFRKRDENE